MRSGADVYTTALDSGSVFAGVDNGSGKRAGFSGDITSLAVAVIVDGTGNREWQSVVGHAGGELVGVSLVSVSSDALHVVFNGSAGDGTAVDFTQSDTISVVTETETVVF